MTAPPLQLDSIEALLGRLDGAPPRDLRVERRPLRGGLEAAGVDHLATRYVDRHGRRRARRVVAKRLTGSSMREALVYERIVAVHARELSPGLLGVERGPDRTVLYLEAVHAVCAWPWGDRLAAQGVLERAASLHTRAPGADAMRELAAAWDHEGELRYTAAATLELLAQVRRRPSLWGLAAGQRWARRVVAALPHLRRQLLAAAPFGSTIIHGDLHPGNVVLRRRNGRAEPVLLDWGRARLGSPLEDVSCWLHSVGTWEAEARRRHDTLLSGYLAARGLPRRLDAGLRAAYWLAGASNALSGALLYHLGVLLDERAPHAARARASHSAREWLRVLRRADAIWS